MGTADCTWSAACLFASLYDSHGITFAKAARIRAAKPSPNVIPTVAPTDKPPDETDEEALGGIRLVVGEGRVAEKELIVEVLVPELEIERLRYIAWMLLRTPYLFLAQP